jgi:hypothetical protein
MLMLPAASGSSAAHCQTTEIVFTDVQQRRLGYLQLTVAAERFLVPPGQPCPDHQACRRLAFARWLHVNRQLPEAAWR